MLRRTIIRYESLLIAAALLRAALACRTRVLSTTTFAAVFRLRMQGPDLQNILRRSGDYLTITSRAYFSVYYYTKCVLLKAGRAALKTKMCNIKLLR